MKIVYGLTMTKNESSETMFRNIKNLLRFNLELILLLNTDKDYIEIDDSFGIDVKVINKVGDMKESRHAILSEFNKIDSDIYMLFDSDILIPEEINLVEELIKYKEQYDFVTLYYKGDPPIPAFFTLASSLNDYYNEKIGKQESVKEVWFDDSDIDNPTYFYPNSNKSNKRLYDVLRGKSYSRDIHEFKNEIDDNDYISGGSTVYFNKMTFEKEFDWEKYNGKSLIWYDSFRTYKLKEMGYKHAKVPVFLLHKRHNETINLNWNSVISYIKGFNLMNSIINNEHNDELMILRALELMHFQRGMIRKIKELDGELIKEDLKEIIEIDEFLNNNDLFVEYCKEKIWK